jgi:hypothetical protein
MGRPKMRWLEDVETDLQEREVERWRQKTVRMGLLLTEFGKSVRELYGVSKNSFASFMSNFFDITKV